MDIERQHYDKEQVDRMLTKTFDYTDEEILDKTVYKINNIEELRKTEGKYEGQVIELLGYYEAGEYSLKYKWTTDLITDDGGYIIRNENNGTWVHEPDSIVKLEDYGVREGNYIDNALASVMKYSEIGKIIEFPQTTTDIGFKISSQKNVKSWIKGNKTKLTFDSKATIYFNFVGDGRISGFICDSKHLNPSEVTNVPMFVAKRSVTNRLVIDDNDIFNLRIHLNSGSSVNLISKNTIIENNIIKADFTGFPIYNIQNDIITAYNHHDLFIRNNDIKGINTNRCFKISSTAESGFDVLCKNIHIYNNRIDLEGVAKGSSNLSEDYLSKQLVDFFQNSFQIYFYNNIIRSRNYAHIIENKSTSAFSYNRFTKISGNEFDVDNCYIYRELGNCGNQTVTDSTGIVKTIFSENICKITSTTDNLKIITAFQTIGVDYLTFKDNIITAVNCQAIANFSNIQRGIFKDNIFENFSIRNQLNTTNNVGDTYNTIYQTLIVQGNKFKYTLPFSENQTSGTYGCFEIRTGGPKVKFLKFTDNEFYRLESLTNNLLPLNIDSSVELLKYVAYDNVTENFPNIYISASNKKTASISDFNNTWTSPNGRKLTERVSFSSSTTSLKPKCGVIMYDAIGTADVNVVVSQSDYNNEGSLYIFKNSMSSNTLTLSSGNGVVLSSITLRAGESVMYMTYKNDEYRLIMQSFRKSQLQPDSTATTVEGVVADFNALLSKLKTAGIMNQQ